MTPSDLEKGDSRQRKSSESQGNLSIIYQGTDAGNVSEEKSIKEPPPACQAPVGDDDNDRLVVDRSKRRGLFGQLTLLAEVENPKTFTRKAKWFITFIVAVSGAAAPMGSAIFLRT